MNSFAPLLLLDAKIEIRKSGTPSRWINLQKLLDKPDITGKGEILSRIRIPFGKLDFQVYRQIGRFDKPSFLSFSAAANWQKHTLTEFSFVFTTHGSQLLRSRELESVVLGRKLPLSEKDKLPALQILKKILTKNSADISGFTRERLIWLMSWVLSRLDPDRLL